ncbi:LuxR C-terminal-related transcriptional regulator [Soonwooa sp.]|uniref:LuxR C-terminal-related transcriptional regulator n=1 Tax=Soonwooa sp. TaxID=1938592 RepID=UPI002629F60E|nr:LuxR C-terminal-related transcriptional regulator [Soonwooa sp.]
MPNNIFRLISVKIIILFLITNCSLMFGQLSESDSLKNVVTSLYKDGDILEINRIVNKNDFTDINYPLSLLNKNLEISKKQNNKDWLADTYLSLGIFWGQKGNLKKAYQYFLDSEREAKQAKNIKKQGQAILNQANVETDLNRKIVKFKQSIPLLETQKDTLSLIKLYLNVGYVYFEKFKTTKPQDSLSYFTAQSKLQYDIAKKLNANFRNTEMQGLILNREAQWYTEEKKYDQALDYFEKSKALFQSGKQLRLKIFSDINIAEIYLAKKDYSNFEKTIASAEKEALDYNIEDYLVTIYDDYREYYTEIGNPTKALEYTKKYYEITISQAEKTSSDKIKVVELENEIKTKELSLSQLETKQRTYYIIFAISALLLLIACFSIYLLRKNNKRKLISIEKDKKIIEVELENKRLKELILQEKDSLNQQYLSSFVKQSEGLNTFLEDLSLRLKKTENLSQADINQIKLEFSKLTNQSSEIKNISNISKSNLQELIVKLKQQFPEITTADTNLISLLYEGFNSKEIATALNISANSVNTKRYRLRKKLKLENDDSFDVFFKQIIAQN